MQTGSEWRSKGQILVTTALMLTVLVGFMGLAIDAGYFFDYRRRMATAADSAAIAAVWELKRNPTPAPTMAARRAAAMNGFTHGTNGITVAVNRPPQSGDYVGKSKYIEVIIKQPHPTFFMRALNIKSTTVAVRAVAGYNDQLGCIYALAPKADSALVISGT